MGAYSVITIYHSNPAIVEETDQASASDFFTQTENAWSLQTYLALRDHPLLNERGISLRLSNNTTADGVLIACSSYIAGDFRPRPSQYFVAVNADGAPHRWADAYIVQNRTQAQWLPSATFVPHWPQPGIIGRSASRSDELRTAVFFGDPPNLAPELRGDEWAARLAAHGIDWQIRGPTARNNADFSDADAVVAVRSFQKTGFLRKPASKLINAWIAGVPAICGAEIAFRETGAAGSAYLEARSVDELFAQIVALKREPERGRQLVSAGTKALLPYTREQVTTRWVDVLSQAAMLHARGEAHRAGQELKKRLRTKAISIHRRVWRMIGQEHNSL